MAKSIDVAVKLLEDSIKQGQSDSRYYMDYVKLHKLMYLSYCYLNYLYGVDLFSEKITANSDGPYIDGLTIIPAICGFGNITNMEDLNELKKFKLTMPLSFSRNEICDVIMDTYGNLDTIELVRIAKDTLAYQHCFDSKHENTICKDFLIKTGEEISINMMKQQEQRESTLTKKLVPLKHPNSK